MFLLPFSGFCGRNNIKPLSTADFGKVMKQVFPTVRPRRLGMRGHSRYCYAAMRKATKLDPPLLPNLSSPGTSSSMGGGDTGFLNGPHVSFSPSEVQSKCASNVDHSPAWEVIRRWAEGALKHSFESSNDLAEYIIKCNLMGEHRGMDGEFKSGPSGTMKEGKKVKDKRKVSEIGCIQIRVTCVWNVDGLLLPFLIDFRSNVHNNIIFIICLGAEFINVLHE